MINKYKKILLYFNGHFIRLAFKFGRCRISLFEICISFYEDKEIKKSLMQRTLQRFRITAE